MQKEIAKEILPFISTMLKGMGHIMLQESELTGLLFLVGIFYDAKVMGIAAILAVFTGILTARVFRFDAEEAQTGLCGFSAALFGVALIYFFQPVFIIWLAIIVGSVASTLIQHWFIVRKIPVFTLPFVLLTWVFLYLFHHVYPVEPSSMSNTMVAHTHYEFTAAIKGFGDVIFQGTAFAGIIIFLGVFVNSPISALYGLAGSIIAAALAAKFVGPVEEIWMGLFSYNAVLCAIVFAGNQPKDGLWALMAVVLSVLINVWMTSHDMVALTFPFVAASCITLAAKKIISLPGLSW